MAQSSDAHDGHVKVPEKRIATPERHLQDAEDSGLCPVQPGLQPTFEREDLAPEIIEGSYDPGQAKCDVSTYPTTEKHAPALTETEKRRRWCGLTRKKFWIFCSLFVLLIIVGAVVGGVIGSRSNHTWVTMKL